MSRTYYVTNLHMHMSMYIDTLHAHFHVTNLLCHELTHAYVHVYRYITCSFQNNVKNKNALIQKIPTKTKTQTTKLKVLLSNATLHAHFHVTNLLCHELTNKKIEGLTLERISGINRRRQCPKVVQVCFVRSLVSGSSVGMLTDLNPPLVVFCLWLCHLIGDLYKIQEEGGG